MGEGIVEWHDFTLNAPVPHLLVVGCHCLRYDSSARKTTVLAPTTEPTNLQIISGREPRLVGQVQGSH